LPSNHGPLVAVDGAGVMLCAIMGATSAVMAAMVNFMFVVQWCLPALSNQVLTESNNSRSL
jgi:hypothetical protein